MRRPSFHRRILNRMWIRNPRLYFIAKLILSLAVYRTHFPVLLHFYLVTSKPSSESVPCIFASFSLLKLNEIFVDFACNAMMPSNVYDVLRSTSFTCPRTFCSNMCNKSPKIGEWGLWPCDSNDDRKSICSIFRVGPQSGIISWSFSVPVCRPMALFYVYVETCAHVGLHAWIITRHVRTPRHATPRYATPRTYTTHKHTRTEQLHAYYTVFHSMRRPCVVNKQIHCVRHFANEYLLVIHIRTAISSFIRNCYCFFFPSSYL